MAKSVGEENQVLSRWTEIRDRIENGVADAVVKKFGDIVGRRKRSVDGKDIKLDPVERMQILSWWTKVRDAVEDAAVGAAVGSIVGRKKRDVADVTKNEQVLSRWTDIRDRVEDGVADAVVKKLGDIIGRRKRSTDTQEMPQFTAAEKMEILSWWTKFRDHVEDTAVKAAVGAAVGSIVGWYDNDFNV